MTMSGRRAFLIVGSVGSGVIIGGGLVWFLWGRRIVSDLARLGHQIESLRREVEQLRAVITRSLPSTALPRNTPLVSRDTKRGTETDKKTDIKLTGDVLDGSSDPTSSTEDEDIFEEAYDGGESKALLNGDIIAEDLDSELTQLYIQVDKLLEGSDNDKEEAYRILCDRQAELSKQVDFVWRFAKSTFFLSELESVRDKERQKKLAYEARDFAHSALQLDDSNANTHKWYAITLGNLGDFESVKNKIQNGFAFKIHIEKAIALNPTDPTLHYLLGRWCFGVYMLSWVERKMAATLFATPPTATVDEALQHFLEADRLNPDKWKENLLFIAKCYIQKGDYYSAVPWLDKADAVQCNGQDDEKAQEEVESVLKQYSSYRS